MANVSDELQQLRKRARRRLIGAIALVIFALTFLWTVLDGEPPKNLVDNHSVEIISSAPALSSIVEGVKASAVVEVAALESVQVTELPVIEASRIAPVALPGKLVSHQAAPARAPVEVADDVAVAAIIAQPTIRQEVVSTPKPVPSKKPVDKQVQDIAPAKKSTVNPADILEGKLTAPAVDTALKSKKTYYVQVGAYADAEKAAQLVSKLRKSGVKASSEKINTSKGELTRVRVGPTEDEAKAKAWIKAMQAEGVSGTLIAKAAQ